MIKIENSCKDCNHSKVCKYINNAENAMKKLKNTIYGDGYDDEYDWDIIMESQKVNVVFSCPNFRKDGGVLK